MLRACCYSVSHADAFLPITTIQDGDNAFWYAKKFHHPDIASVLEQVVGECDGVCVCVQMCCICDCTWYVSV